MLRPPGLVDFDGSYTAWAAKESAGLQKPSAPAAKSKSKSAPPPQPKPAAKRADNPWARPFGRLTLAQLEKQITETEIALGECQQLFSDGDTFKDPSKGSKLQNEHDALAKKLKELEAEYFAREQ